MATNKPWEKYAAVDSKPWEKYAETSPVTPVAPETSLADTALAAVAGVGQGGTAGLGDELYGVQGAITGALGSIGTDQPMLDAAKQGYTENRDYARDINKGLEKQSPIAYNAGDIGAGIGLTAGIPLGAAKGASTLAKVATPLASGALQGGVESFGRSEASNPTDIVNETAIGALSGVVVGGAGELISGGVGRVAKKFGTPFENAANKAAGQEMGNVSKEVAALSRTPIESKTLGEQLKLAEEANGPFWGKNYLKENVVSGNDSEKLAKVMEVKSKASGIINDFASTVDSKKPPMFDTNELINVIKKDNKNSIPLFSNSKFDEAIKTIENAGKDGPITLTQAGELRGMFDDFLNSGASASDKKIVANIADKFDTYYLDTLGKGMQGITFGKVALEGYKGAKDTLRTANIMERALQSKPKVDLVKSIKGIAKDAATGAVIGGIGGSLTEAAGLTPGGSYGAAGIGAVLPSVLRGAKSSGRSAISGALGSIKNKAVLGAVEAGSKVAKGIGSLSGLPTKAAINYQSDKIVDPIQKGFSDPEFGNYLKKKALENPTSAIAAHFTLMQQNPKYRDRILNQ